MVMSIEVLNCCWRSTDSTVYSRKAVPLTNQIAARRRTGAARSGIGPKEFALATTPADAGRMGRPGRAVNQVNPRAGADSPWTTGALLPALIAIRGAAAVRVTGTSALAAAA